MRASTLPPFLVLLLAPAPGRPEEAADRHGDPLPAGAVVRLGTVRFRHGEFIASLAFAPDGKTVATTEAGSHVLRLWDATTGREVRRFVGQAGGFAGAPAVFSPDGRTLAAGDAQKNLLLWDVATGKKLHCHPNLGWATSLAWAPDGRRLAVADYAGGLIVIDPYTGRTGRTFTGHAQRVERVAFAADGSRLVSGGLDGTVRLWDPVSGKEVRQVARHQNRVGAVAFSPDGRLVASGGGFVDGTVILSEAATGAEVRRFRADHSNWGMTALAFSPDGRLLASGGGDLTNRLWDVASGREVRRFNHAGKATSVCALVAFSPDGKVLAGRGPLDTVLCLWDVATGRLLSAQDAHLSAVAAVAVAADGTRIASGARDGSTHVWDAGTGALLQRLAGHADGVSRVAFAPDGRLLASLGADRSLRLWETRTGKASHRLPAEGDGCLAFSADGRTLAAGNAHGAVTLWETASGRRLGRFQAHPERLNRDGESYVPPVSVLAFAPDGRSLAVGADEGEVVRLFDVMTLREVRRFQLAGPQGKEPPQHPALGFSPDGRTLLTASDSRPMRVWEVASGKERRQVGIGFSNGSTVPRTAVISPDARMLAWWGQYGDTLHVCDLTTGREVAQRRGHQGHVLAAAFSSDGRRLVSASADTTLLVWDLPGLASARPARTVKLSARELETLWKDLAGEDAARAYRAIQALVADVDAVRWLSDRLPPVPHVDRQRLRHLVGDLGSDHFEVRRTATAELEVLAELARPALQDALSANPSLEVRRRVEQLLEKVARRALTPEQLRVLRAVEVLEHVGSPEASAVLRKLAGGATGSRTTEDAQASLARLARAAGN
jgi:WD40 repeat protein